MAHRMKKSGRPALTLSDFEAVARHFNYELRMLFFPATQLGGWHASPPTIGNDDWKNVALDREFSSTLS